jgi:hypothetical protein
MIDWRLAGRSLRPGAAALCLAAAGVLAVLGTLEGGCTPAEGRLALGTGFAALVAVHDLDGDGALDRDEVRAMVAETIPAERTGSGWTMLRAWLVSTYMGADRNGDGRLTVAELADSGLAIEDGPDFAPLNRADVAP